MKTSRKRWALLHAACAAAVAAQGAAAADGSGRASSGPAIAAGANTPMAVPTIKGMEINPAKAKSSEAVTIKVLGTGTCKYRVDFGNGISMDREEALPASFQNSFIVASYETRNFTVTASALGGCKGSAQASVTIGEPLQSNSSTGLKLQNANPAVMQKNCPPGQRC